MFSRNHRTVGLQYFFLALAAALLGTAMSLLMRFHMVNPTASVSWFERIWPVSAAGGVMATELYLSLLTMHGTLMVFFVLTTAPQAAFGNMMLPPPARREGNGVPVPEHAVLLAYRGFAMLHDVRLLRARGRALSGWTAYPPLSAVGAIAGPGQGAGQTLWLVSIGIFCAATLLTSVNFITTVIELRSPDIPLMKMPLTCWNWFVTAILSLLAFSVLLPSVVLLLCDRLAGTVSLFRAGLLVADQRLPNGGGSPLLWEHLFWFSDIRRFISQSFPAWA